MSIISSNPHHDCTVTDERRLSAVREALFGEKPTAGRTTIDDEMSLFFILSEKYKPGHDRLMRGLLPLISFCYRELWQMEIDRLPMTMREAARIEAKFARHRDNREESSIADRLRSKSANHDFTAQDMADLEGLIYGNSPKAEDLALVMKILNRFDVQIDSPLVKNSAN